MIAFLISAALLCAGSDARYLDYTAEGACLGIEDDCEVASTSLLQETVSLLKRNAGHELEERPHKPANHHEPDEKPPSLAGLRATVEASSISDQLLMILFVLGVVVVLGLVAYYSLVLPAQHRAARRRRGSLPLHGTEGAGRRANAAEALILDYQCDDHDMVEVRNEDSFEEDSFGLAVALIVRDLHAISHSNCNKKLRMSRLAFSMGLIFLTVTIQISIIVCTKKYTTPQQVAAIRGSYDEYEQAMYGEHTEVNQHGKHRGIAGFFNASAFDALDDDLKSDICNIPLSQLGFISLILLVWAITCLVQLKKSLENFAVLILFSLNIQDMTYCCYESSPAEDPGEEDGSKEAWDIEDTNPVLVITGLTWRVKVFLSTFVFFPDIFSTIYVLWLGSRWLVATNDFGNVLSNAVALEFVLMLKRLIFFALASERNKRDLAHTAVAPCWGEEPAGYTIYFSSTIWALLAVLWVYYYVYHQAVLPDYKWDVHSVCTPWLQNQLSKDD